jgi:tetratricopeptide (TPR) repeat protein
MSVLAVVLAKKCGYIFTGWFWYLGTLVPVAGFVQTGYHAQADRYTYIPLTGLFIMIAWGVPSIFSRWRLKKWALCLLACGVLAALIPVTALQLRYWRNTGTLFSHTVKLMPDNAVAHNALGYYFFKQGKAEEAYGHFVRAVRSNPHYTKAQYNLGCVLAGFGRLDEAADCFRAVLRIYPDDVKAHTRLGRILLRQGKTGESIGHFQQALAAQPDYGEAQHFLRKALAAQAAQPHS